GRLGAEQLKEACRGSRSTKPLRLGVRRDEVVCRVAVRHQAFKGSRLVSPIEKVSRRHRKLGELRKLGLSENHQTLRIFIGKRPKQPTLTQAKDAVVCPNTQPNPHDRHYCKPRILQQHSSAISQILNNVRHKNSLKRVDVQLNI